jgi:Tfp pilus assembly protein PilO
MSDEMPDAALPFSDIWRQMEFEIERLRAENETLRRDVKTAVMGDSAELQDVKRENEKLREALEVIVNPIPAMQKQAEIDCVNLSGVMSIQIADSVNFLRSIARKALESGE